MAHSLEDLRNMLEEKIIFGLELIAQLKKIENLDGGLKLQRKIRQEIYFLKRVNIL